MVKQYLVDWTPDQEWAVQDWDRSDAYVVLASDYAALEARCRAVEEEYAEYRACDKPEAEAAEKRIAELEAALRKLSQTCNGELGCKGYRVDEDLNLTASETAELPSDCSGDPNYCGDNEGRGCVCSRHRASIPCKRSHPHDDMDYDCKLMTLVERQAAKARRSALETPVDGWQCVCGLTVRKRYTCLCGGREDNSDVNRGGK